VGQNNNDGTGHHDDDVLVRHIATAAGPCCGHSDDSRYYLCRSGLDNFEQETTTCRDNGGECKRDADNIRRVLGLRSTTDPLFQIEKVFGKVKNDESIDVEQLDDFYAATEDWTSAINMSNSMAFISQFGEYNPGGGKDEVLKYLLESQKQLILARDALQTICTVLNVKV
jgi:hypothetical protein